MKRKYKQWLWIIPIRSTKGITIFHLNWLNTEKGGSQHITLEIQFLSWDMNTNVGRLNQLMWSYFFPSWPVHRVRNYLIYMALCFCSIITSNANKESCVFYYVDYLSFCTFSFGRCVICSSSIYGFWLPLWYLHTLLDVCFVSSTDVRIVFTPIYFFHLFMWFALFICAYWCATIFPCQMMIVSFNNYTTGTICGAVTASILEQEEFEDTKGAIRIHISKTNRQHNVQNMSIKNSLMIPKG